MSKIITVYYFDNTIILCLSCLIQALLGPNFVFVSSFVHFVSSSFVQLISNFFSSSFRLLCSFRVLFISSVRVLSSSFRIFQVRQFEFCVRFEFCSFCQFDFCPVCFEFFQFDFFARFKFCSFRLLEFCPVCFDFCVRENRNMYV